MQSAVGDPERPVIDTAAIESRRDRLAASDVFVMPGAICGVPGHVRLSLTASDAMVEDALARSARVAAALRAAAAAASLTLSLSQGERGPGVDAASPLPRAGEGQGEGAATRPRESWVATPHPGASAGQSGGVQPPPAGRAPSRRPDKAIKA